MNKAAFSAQGVTFNDPPPLYFTTQLPREPSGTFPPKGKAHAQESWPAFLSAFRWGQLCSDWSSPPSLLRAPIGSFSPSQ